MVTLFEEVFTYKKRCTCGSSQVRITVTMGGDEPRKVNSGRGHKFAHSDIYTRVTTMCEDCRAIREIQSS